MLKEVGSVGNEKSNFVGTLVAPAELGAPTEVD